jgi:predicted nucleotidyltransferase
VTRRPRGRGRSVDGVLDPGELRAAMRVVERVRTEVDAELVHATLFGSRARGEGRPDSDIDLLLIFRRLPADREPYATQAERIAEEVAARTGLPVTVWSVSLPDLDEGQRTPMLVDALEDSLPLWWAQRPVRPVPFTPPDALRCVAALLDRVAEGGEEFADHRAAGRSPAALRRGRDDLVRLCTATLLLEGVTRPRRAEAVLRALDEALPESPRAARVRPVLLWAAASFGPTGRDEDAPLPPPPGGALALAASVEALRDLVRHRRARLAHRLDGRGNTHP